MRFLLFLLLSYSQPVYAGPFQGGIPPSSLWLIPFVGLLLCIALLPLKMPQSWHQHYGKIAGFWSVMTVVAILGTVETRIAFPILSNIFLNHYFPFICLIAALFIISGGIHISVRAHGVPLTNTLWLVCGSLVANLVGTTGAAMLFLQPLIRMNSYRYYKTHIIIFFIFMVCNCGGCLTPIGDPPLFLGFLEGVPFSWTLTHLGKFFFVIIGALSLLFFCVDRVVFRYDKKALQAPPLPNHAWIHVQGGYNIAWLLLAISLVIISGVWCDSPQWADLSLADGIRDVGLLIIAWIVKSCTPSRIYESNHFSYEPLKEVAILFAAIFITVTPVISLLHAGEGGPFAPLLKALNPNGQPNNFLYFWLSGVLSSFLDNAPTYLVFFHLAGGEATRLANELSATLIAISCGAVFMGAMTYIGNAPNFMVKAIAEHAHVRMPSFFGYIVWSCAILLPLLIMVSWYTWG